MDCSTGRIYTPEQLKQMYGELIPKNLKPMDISPTPQQMARRPPRVGRNDPCPCGSGMKFKYCCYTGTGRQFKR